MSLVDYTKIFLNSEYTKIENIKQNQNSTIANHERISPALSERFSVTI